MQENPGKNECNVTDILTYVGISYKHATKQDLARISRALMAYGWLRIHRPEVPGMVFKKQELGPDSF